MWEKIKGAFDLWNVGRSISSAALRREAALPVNLFVIGDLASFDQLTGRLGSLNAPTRIDAIENVPKLEGTIILNAAHLANLSDKEFDSALAKIATRHAERRIALAAAVPAFRLIVASQLSHDRAFENSRYAALSALPGVIPLTDWLLPASSAADLWVLTKNQITLLLEVAACFGKPPDVRARVKELLPVVGNAFGWRAIARELIGLVPGGVGIVVKAAIAYAGTYSVGKAAAYYYAGNTVGANRQSYRVVISEAIERARTLLVRK
jgi:uncharacterized protein (DUF697 family)